MNIDHIAIWTTDIERLKSFYETYFDAKSGKKYVNETKRFQSYFLTFNSGARLEIMQKPEIPDRENKSIQFSGYAHIAISVGSKKNVDDLTQKLIDDGYKNPDGPRHTGDGYYESVILDPDGNRIEITE
jgi:lactoylglutathione lyase